MRKLTPYQFFKKHAGYSYDPVNETKEHGKRENARRLANAEDILNQCEGDIITYTYFEDFAMEPLGDGETIEDYKSGKYTMFTCAIYRKLEHGRTCLASVGGVSVKSDNDPYMRVIRAELALEAMPDLLDLYRRTK